LVRLQHKLAAFTGLDSSPEPGVVIWPGFVAIIFRLISQASTEGSPVSFSLCDWWLLT